ncbi:MAG: bifunctional diaminohydroxyphosphoribosylaminopyrimidine deaminase/5-amino-6-(5-phosphoribosylamino)uracil reductase RibD [Planctomycetota bacterium]
MDNKNNQKYMLNAIKLAENGLGWSSPNPAVGCILVKNNQIIAEGWTQPFGKAHAEAAAVEKAGEDARGATAYVTLMPCAHHGKTPPCTDAIIKSGIKRVVVAIDDPNPTSLNGKEVLEKNDIKVSVGICAEEAAEGLAGFLKHTKTGSPLISLKYAMTLDGKIATKTGSSSWISCEESRADVQYLRSKSDAVMVGSGTVKADNPRLNVRDNEKWQPSRVIIDSTAGIPLESKLFSEPGGKIVVVTTEKADNSKIKDLESNGAEIMVCSSDSNNKVNLSDAVKKLGEKGITSILCESGGKLSGTLFDNNLIDEVTCYLCPKICGGSEAHSPVAGRGIELMDNAVELNNLNHTFIGSDIKVTGRLGTWKWLKV